jgi:hypothetical protein
MSVRVTSENLIELSGHCGAEDAEALQRCLLAARGSPVEWSGCEQLHSAVLQVLLTERPPMQGRPENEFINTHIARLLCSADT